MLELFAGKVTVDQSARRLGVHAATVNSTRCGAAAAGAPPRAGWSAARELERAVATLFRAIPAHVGRRGSHAKEGSRSGPVTRPAQVL